MKPFQNKSIILATTEDWGMYKCIVENLKFLGFTVHLLTFKDYKKFKYKSIKDRLVTFYRSKFLKDKHYIQKLRKLYYRNLFLSQLDDFPNTDYSLTIRPDFFHYDVINRIKELSPKNYAYHWDNLSKNKEIIHPIHLFDKFYVFDKSDLTAEFKTYPATNFYFDCYDFMFQNNNIEYDFYYLGTYGDRINNKLIPICLHLHEKEYKLNIILKRHSPAKHLKRMKYISFIKKPSISYFQNLEHLVKSKFLIDIHEDISIQTGLSFRILESIGYNKKIITTNTIVNQYDFYDPNNILIISGDEDISKIDNFLKTEYKPLPKEIKEKYSFSNWIKYILEIDGNTPIQIW